MKILLAIALQWLSTFIVSTGKKIGFYLMEWCVLSLHCTLTLIEIYEPHIQILWWCCLQMMTPCGSLCKGKESPFWTCLIASKFAFICIIQDCTWLQRALTRENTPNNHFSSVQKHFPGRSHIHHDPYHQTCAYWGRQSPSLSLLCKGQNCSVISNAIHHNKNWQGIFAQLAKHGQA